MKIILLFLMIFISCNSGTYRSKFDSFSRDATFYHGKVKAYLSVGEIDSAISNYNKESDCVDSAHYYYLKLYK